MKFKGERFIIQKADKKSGSKGVAFIFPNKVYSILFHNMTTWKRMRLENPVPLFGFHKEKLEFIENESVYDEFTSGIFIFPFAFRKNEINWDSKKN